MNVLRNVLQVPLFVLIVYVGAVNLLWFVRALPSFTFLYANWTFYFGFLEGALEVAVLIWLYRRLAPRPRSAHPQP